MAQGASIARSLVAPGVREAEAWLLEELRARAEEARKEPRRLAQPVRVVVPGGPLRELFVDRMVRALGGAVVGVRVQTLWSLALEVLEGAGETVQTGAHLFELVARRQVAREKALRTVLDGLEDGAGLAAGAISDLLSARIESAEPKALEAALAALPREERERTGALIRTARATRLAMREVVRSRFADVYEDAARCLEGRGDEQLPARALYVHGFSGATGQAAAFLAALLRRSDACLLLVEPASAEGAGGLDDALAHRLSQRLVGDVPRPIATELAVAPRLEAFEAWGEGDELREVALRVRALLEQGVRPESIGIVARTLQPRALALRRAFEEHGVPFGGGEEPAGVAPMQRRLDAVLEVLRDARRTSADRWLDSLGDGFGERREDLRAALRASGVARLTEVAALARADWLARLEQVPLPHRGGMPDERTPDERPARRTLAREHLLAAADAAQHVLDVVDGWPDGAPIDAHARQLEGLVEALGIAPRSGADADSALEAAWTEAMASLDELVDLPAGPTRTELAHLLEAALRAATAHSLGGAGAGVRVLGAQEARGAVFEHLFLVGLERGSFPRMPRADPLLSDRARETLSAALPDLEPREHQHAEERWLFHALGAAAPHVTLSWLHADEEGHEVAPSPFVLRALAAAGVQALKVERRREHLGARPPRTARELAIATALTSPRADLESALGLAFEEGLERFGEGLLPAGCTVGELAAARLQVLDEIEPDRSTREGRALLALPGPWLGAAGAGALPADGPVFVTRLEGLARCPWQGFLLHGLGLEPAPDPLRDLPDLGPHVLGNAVHGALQRLLAPGSPRRTGLAEALARPARRVGPSDPKALEAALQHAAQHALEEAGLRLPGLTQALVERARPFVMNALALVGSDASVLGAEVDGLVDAPVSLAFRADLLLLEDEHPILIDFKTGKPLSDGKRPQTRAKHLLEQTREGQRLQGMAYALAAPSARGAYLFVKPDLEQEHTRFVVDPSDEALVDAFHGAVARLAGAWRAGVVPPRPETSDGKANSACEWCDVRMACLRDDTGNRRRLIGVAAGAARDASGTALTARLAALLSGEAPDGPTGEEAPQ